MAIIRCAIKEKQLLDLFGSLQDESSNIVNTKKKMDDDPTYRLMAVNNAEDLEALSFQEIMNGFRRMYDNLELYLDSSQTLELADKLHYAVRAGNEKSPFKRRRIL